MNCACIWGLAAIQYFPNYLRNGNNLEIKLLRKKLCFDFPLQISSKTFHIVKGNERDAIKYILGFSKSDCKET